MYPANNVWVARFGNANGTFDAPVASTMSSANKAYAMVIDYDGDGLSDVLQPDGNPGNWQVLRWSGTALQAVQTGIPALGILGAHFTADLNGDGLYDVIWIVPKSVTGTNDELHVRWNTPGGFSAAELLATFSGTGPRPFGAESSYFRSAVRRADINGDGQTDFFVFYSSSGQICDPELGCFPVSSNIWQGFLSLPPAFPRAYALGGVGSSATAPLMMDINGDGNTDGGLVWSFNNNNYLTTRISKGDTTYVESQRLFPYTSASSASIADWDGDGRNDLLVPEWNGTEHELKMYRSNGTAFENGVWTGSLANWTNWYRRRVMDVNGDGFSDIVWHNGTTWETRLHRGGKPDLLALVTDGFGNTTSVVYAPLTSADVYTKLSGAAAPIVRDYQGPSYVAKSVTYSDGIGGAFTVSNSYSGARIHTQGRGFLGFASKTAVDSRNNLAATKNFYQEFPYVGLPQEERLKLGGTTLALVTYGVDKKWFGAGYETWGFPYVKDSTRFQYELGGALVRKVTATSSFDDFGNLLDSSTDVSDAALNTFTTDIHREYQNDVANWCLGRLTLESVVQTAPGLPSEMRSRTATHDTTYCRVETVTEQPGALQTFTDFDYDAWGNQSVIKVTGAGMPTRQTTRSFAPQGTFPTEIYNAKGHKTTHSWNYALGVEASRTDPNLLTTTWQHDGFGRVVAELRPDGTTTELGREYCSLGCGVSRGYYKLTTSLKNTANGLPGGNMHTVFDAVDRPVRKSRELLLGQESHVLTEYDALGRTQRTSTPHFAGGSVFWSVYAYDALNRVTTENHPHSESQPSGRQVRYAYSPLQVSITDPRNNITTRRENARGEIVEVTDALGSKMEFSYSPFGELRSTKDHLGNVKSMTYDSRGRKVAMTDPDMGTWTYHHNALGELDTQNDPKGTQVTFLHDALGRMTHRYEPEATTIWEYDTASGKGVGQLAEARMETPAGAPIYAEYFVYDGQGRPQETTTDPGDGSLYTISAAYDDLGRVGTVTYPDTGLGDRFAVRYIYDSSGALLEVANVADAAQVFWHANAMNAFGQVTDERLGNNLVTTRAFDLARGLLSGLVTGAGAVQDLAYGWDEVGNLLSRQDARQGLAESFVYDPLNRLDEVRLNGALALDPQYNAIGNITSKSDVGSYTYGAKPQAVTAAGGKTYGYDANGNMTSRAGASVNWSSYNLPTQIGGANGTDSFSYSPSRARYRHVATQTLAGGLLASPLTTTTETIYIGSLYEKVTTLVLTEHRHHVLVGGRMVAQVTRRATGDLVHYFHRDHQGSLDAITDAAGQVAARLSFDAFGQRRNPETWSGAPNVLELISIQAITSRGYTGHEMLDASGTIHMNGRVHDPLLGRVLSADPTVPGIWNAQAHNRYSYAFNNPLSFADPTGFEPEGTPIYGGQPCTPRCDTITTSPSSGFNVDRAELLGDMRSLGNMGGLLGLSRLALKFVMSLTYGQTISLDGGARFDAGRSSADGAGQAASTTTGGASGSTPNAGVNLRMADSDSFTRSFVRSEADRVAQYDLNILNVAVLITPGVSAVRAALGSAWPKAVCFFCTGLNPTVDAHGVVVFGRGSTQMLKIEAMRERAQSGLQLETRLRNAPTLPE